MKVYCPACQQVSHYGVLTPWPIIHAYLNRLGDVGDISLELSRWTRIQDRAGRATGVRHDSKQLGELRVQCGSCKQVAFYGIKTRWKLTDALLHFAGVRHRFTLALTGIE